MIRAEGRKMRDGGWRWGIGRRVSGLMSLMVVDDGCIEGCGEFLGLDESWD